MLPATTADKVLEKEKRTILTSDSSLDEKLCLSKIEKSLDKVTVDIKNQVVISNPLVADLTADDKSNTKKKKRKKQGEKSNNTNYTIKAFLDEPNAHLTANVTTRRSPASLSDHHVNEKFSDKVKSKLPANDENKKLDLNKTSLEKRTKTESKKASNKLASTSAEKVTQDPLAAGTASKSLAKRGKTTAKTENSSTDHKVLPNAEATFASQAKEKSQHKRVQAEQTSHQRNQITVEASSKQTNRKKNTKTAQKSLQQTQQEKVIANGQDHISANTTAGISNRQSRDKSASKEGQKLSKERERISKPSDTINQDKSDNINEVEKLTENG